MLEESPAATALFIQQWVVGRRLHLYECTGRGPDGPECGPFPLGAFQLNGNQTVVDPDTGAAPTFHAMRTWIFDDGSKLLRFLDGAGSYLDLQIGAWRWGEDAEGQPFLAGLQTIEDDAIPRREIQSNAIYGPRYFEDWDVAGLDYDGDTVTDIVDTCPVVANLSQSDSDGDGLGDACDPTPVNPPPYVAAGDGTAVGRVTVTWYAAAGATHYRVFRSTTDDPLTATAVSGWQTSRTFNDASVVPGADYHYWVSSAISSTGSGASGLSMGDGGWAALAAPAGVTASDGTVPDHVHVTWSSVSGAQAYRIWSSWTSDPLTATILGTWQPGTSYDDASISPGSIFYYWVDASPYPSGGRTSSRGGPDSGWYLTSVLFADGFESGDTSAWSASAP